MITFEELKNKLRTDYANYIKPLVIKDKCELCGYEENLVVHHDKEFSILLDETLKELNLYKIEFNEDEVNIIRTHMLGKQIQIKNITLCNKCHTELHKNKGGFSSTGKYIDINKIKEMKRKKEKEIKLKEKEKVEIGQLENWLNNHINDRLYSDEQQELSDLIIKELTTLGNNIDYRTKKLKPKTLETLLRDKQLNFTIKEQGKNVNPKTKKKQRWISIGVID